MIKLLLIAVGGAVGAVLRYGVASGVERFSPGGFPAGTLVVNTLGCFAIGIVGAMLAGSQAIRDEHRMLIVVGLLGAFTTFSTYGWETLELITARQWGLALLNVVMSNVVGLGGVWLGYRLGSA